jgi:hypothetical protein
MRPSLQDLSGGRVSGTAAAPAPALWPPVHRAICPSIVPVISKIAPDVHARSAAPPPRLFRHQTISRANQDGFFCHTWVHILRCMLLQVRVVVIALLACDRWSGARERYEHGAVAVGGLRQE